MNPFAALATPIKDRPGTAIPPTPAKRHTRDFKASDMRFPEVPNPWGLTGTQCEIVRRLTAGETYREIAKELFIGVSTLEGHVNRVKEKMGVERTILAILKWDRTCRGGDAQAV